MTDGSPSGQILARLEIQAAGFDKAPVRLASLRRLKQACDAIADERLGPNVRISPSTVEKYVKKRHKEGSADWTGPTRVFISSDTDLRAYVTAREEERRKPADARKRPSQRQRDIEDAISVIPGVEMRQVVRHELEDGRLAKRRLELLSKGLRSLPDIDVDALLNGTAPTAPGNDGKASEGSTTDAGAERSRDARVIAALLDRFGDATEMARAGLECDGKRVRMSNPPRTAIVRPDEMAALRRFAGTVQAPAAAAGGTGRPSGGTREAPGRGAPAPEDRGGPGQGTLLDHAGGDDVP